MSETCAVCHKGEGPEKCEVCGFSDNGFIYRSFPIPEDTQNWLETVVKPYRIKWEAKKREAELLAQLEKAKKREAKLLAQLEVAKKRETELLKQLETPKVNAIIRPKLVSATFTDSRDGKVYKTVKIGKQVWMAENLNYVASGSKCYNDDPANTEKYGRLYDWETAKKVCPTGWHLPSYYEWQTLVDFVGGEEIAGNKLKARSDWKKDGNGEDTYGFSALPGGCGLPGGYGVSLGGFSDAGLGGHWWSASENGSYDAYSRGMDYAFESAYWSRRGKGMFFSVRCLQDY